MELVLLALQAIGQLFLIYLKKKAAEDAQPTVLIYTGKGPGSSAAAAFRSAWDERLRAIQDRVRQPSAGRPADAAGTRDGQGPNP